MSANARILVATDVVADAGLVRKLLSEEFENVSTSTEPDRSVQDFERSKPQVLILAFNTLEKAERYYLGLYRLSTLVHALPHRTLILCNKDDVRRVYALCKKEYFDDYILFWPMTHDTPRLPMAVIHALRQMTDGGADGPTVRELAAQARRIAELETQLARYAMKGGQHMAIANRSLQLARREIGAALDGFSCKLSDGELRDFVEVKDRRGFQREIDRLKNDEIGKRFEAVVEAVEPLTLWIDSIDEEFAPQVEVVRELQTLAAQVRPVVLVVDDDEFQQKLLGRFLAELQLELIFAASGTEALGTLRRCRPDLVLMDVNLPDIDGIEATRRLKSVGQFAAVPVIMITGRSEKNVVVESLKAGAADFVVKPVDKDVLLTKVRNFLGIALPTQDSSGP